MPIGSSPIGSRLDDFEKAYGVFARAGDTGALKVFISR